MALYCAALNVDINYISVEECIKFLVPLHESTNKYRPLAEAN
jgi:hypothetical protein